MKTFLSVVVMALVSQSAWAGWTCTAKCSGSSSQVLDSLTIGPSGIEAGNASDFQANCTQVLGGTIGTTSPTYCGAYYYCYKNEKSAYEVTGSGDGLIAA